VSADTKPPSASVAPAVNVFDDSNRRSAHEARSCVEQAEKLFLAQQYTPAGELYARAEALSSESVTSARDRFAYCKMCQVVERLNNTAWPIGQDEWPELETQVRRAMTLWPRLEQKGTTLLTTIRDRRTGAAEKSRPVEPQAAPEPAAPAITVKHARAPGAAWALAETANFRVFHNVEPSKAEEVVRIAEATRAAMQQKWFGKVEEDWVPRCDIYLYPDAETYARQTGVRGSAPGHARTSMRGDRVVERQLHMRLDVPDMLTKILPHETTHVVLAGRFGSFPVPRWADEGMAVLTEPREQVARHLQNLPAHRDEQSLFQVQGLLEMRDYPHPRQIGAFYAQSVSVVEYLSSLKGPQVFAQFLADGLRGGYEPALRKHYGIQGYADLQSRWQGYAFKDSPAAGIAQGDN
jgi:hypothetical protein